MRSIYYYIKKCIVLTGAALSLVSPVQAAIPVSHIKGIDELFKDEYRIYSPLVGLTHQKILVHPLYGSQSEELIGKLTTLLFAQLPGGEITVTHLAKNPATHLSGAIIAKIFVEFEILKSEIKSGRLDSSKFGSALNQGISSILIESDDYKASLRRAQENIENSRLEYAEFKRRCEERRVIDAQEESFRTLNIIPLDRKIKKLKSEIKTKKDESSLDWLNEQEKKLQNLNQERSNYLKMIHHEKGPLGVINSQQKRKALEKLNYQLEINDVASELYQDKFAELVQTLVDCFLKYDFVHNLDEFSKQNYQYSTAASLLSYLWLKYTDKADLRPFLETMAALGAMKDNSWNKLSEAFYRDYYSQNEYVKLKQDFLSSWFKESWVNKHFVDALVYGLDAQANPTSKVPELIPFSYVRWVKYSWFPDCWENSLHNIVDFIAFNPKTGLYDEQILQKLKEGPYPRLSPLLIDYYKTHVEYGDHESPDGRRDWIQMTTFLIKEETANNDMIGHHDHGKLWELTGPYLNLVKAVNLLMGYEGQDANADHMAEIFTNVQAISGLKISYMNPKGNDYFGAETSFKLESGTFLLTSYGAAHVSFSMQKGKNNKTVSQLAQIFSKKCKKIKSKVNPVEAFRCRYGADVFDALQGQGAQTPL
ncbi:MAG: hypothetical protein ABIQ95_01315 [Bdellovibrionia bacterium]